MRKKRFLIVIVLLIGVLAKFLFDKNHPTPLPTAAPNVILISVDTLRADHMSTYGYMKETTPRIDRFAKNATVFAKAYTIMPMTINSFYTLFSGNDWVFKKESLSIQSTNLKNAVTNQTLTTILKENNYYTSAFITNPALGMIGKDFFRNGFDQFSYINTLPNEKSSYRKIFSHEYNNGRILTDKALLWLKQNKDKKFFLWLHYDVTHQPYNPPLKYLCQIDKECNIDKYKSLLSDANFVLYKELPLCGTADQDVVEKAKNLYDAEILATDDLIGIVMDKLKSLGLYDNALIVFYGDHGEGFEHNMFGHGKSLYESSIRIPLIIKSSEQLSSRTTPLILDNSDILPTILGLLRIKSKSNSITGSNFASELSKPTPQGKNYVYTITSNRDAVFNSKKGKRFSIRDRSYAYIFSENHDCLYKNYKEELYNLFSDPEESINIIDAKPDIAKQLKKKLLEEIGKRVIDIKEDDPSSKEVLEQLKSIGY